MIQLRSGFVTCSAVVTSVRHVDRRSEAICRVLAVGLLCESVV